MKKQEIRIRVAALVKQDDSLLLIAHKKDGHIYWLPPGGGVDYGESLSSALSRELSEELSIAVEPGEILYVSDGIDPQGERHVVHIIFEAEWISGELKLGDDARLYDFAFFPADELESLDIHPPINRVLSDYLKGHDASIYLGELWKEKQK